MKKLVVSVLIAVFLLAGALGLLPRNSQAQFEVTTIVLSASSATVLPAQSYVLTATGFAAAEQVEFLINDIRLGRVNASGAGVATSTVRVPTDLPKGTVTFKAKNADGSSIDTQTATLNPGLVVSAASGSAGSEVRVQGFAFSVQETYALTFTNEYSATSPTCVETGSTVSSTLESGTASKIGSFNETVEIPAVAAGTYYIVGRGATSGVCAVY
jgi:hypothetical protein